MANHGKARHLKRMAAPRFISIERKSHRYLRGPQSGRHKKTEAMSMLVLLRDVLKLASNRSEAKRILSAGKVLVDGIARKSEAFPVGLMDIVSIPVQGVFYRMIITQGKLAPSQISEKEGAIKLCKVVGKTNIKKGKTQLAFHDGRTQLVEKEEDRFSLGDTVKLSIPGQKIAGFIKLAKGVRCYIHFGRHAGKMAMLESLLERAGSTATDAQLKTADGQSILTRKSYVFAVDDDFKI